MKRHEFTPAIMALEDAAGEMIERARALALGAQHLRRQAGLPGREPLFLLPGPSDGEPLPAAGRAGTPKKARGGKPKKHAGEPRKNQDKPPAKPSQDCMDTAPAPGTLKARVVAALTRIGRPASVAEVLAAAGGSKESVRMTLKRSVALGEIEARGETRWRRYWVIGGYCASGAGQQPAGAPGSTAPEAEKHGRGGEPRTSEAAVEIGRPQAAADWLMTRDYRVQELANRAGWLVDGRHMATIDMLAKANRLRADLNLPPFRLRVLA